MELLLLGAECPGLGAGCPGQPDVRGSRAGCSGSGFVDKLDELRGGKATLGQNSDDLVDGNCGEDGGKLDPHVAKKIHGSNPKKLHEQQIIKKIGAIFGGDFWIRRKNNKIKLKNKE